MAKEGPRAERRALRRRHPARHSLLHCTWSDRSRHRDELRRDRGRGGRRRAAAADPRQSRALAARRARALWRRGAGDRRARASRSSRGADPRARSPRPASASTSSMAVAAAAGPGLIGGLIVGSMAAKGIAWAARKPFIAVNHLEAHALTARLSRRRRVSLSAAAGLGRPSQLLVCAGVGRYRQLGTSRDDAAGEAFDKTAKLLGLGYPGGPAIERAARDGDPAPLRAAAAAARAAAGCDFSFSGLKTAVRADGRAMRRRSTRETSPISPQRSSWRSATRWSTAPPTRVAWFRRALSGRARASSPPAGSPPIGGCADRLAALRRRCRPRLCRAAAGAVHRQRRDDRLGRARTAAPRPRRWARCAGAAALAARPGCPMAAKGRRVKRLAVIGGGAWGTALALVAAPRRRGGRAVGARPGRRRGDQPAPREPALPARHRARPGDRRDDRCRPPRSPAPRRR